MRFCNKGGVRERERRGREGKSGRKRERGD